MRSDVTSLVDAQLWYVGDEVIESDIQLSETVLLTQSHVILLMEGEGHLLYYSAWRNGVLLEMKSELQELSPIFSTRAVTFLRF